MVSAKALEYGAMMDQGQDILDNISTGVLGLDGDLRITSLNSAGEALLKTSAARCLGAHARQLVLDPGEWLANLRQVVQSKNPLTRRGMPLTLGLPSTRHPPRTFSSVNDPNTDPFAPYGTTTSTPGCRCRSSAASVRLASSSPCTSRTCFGGVCMRPMKLSSPN